MKSAEKDEQMQLFISGKAQIMAGLAYYMGARELGMGGSVLYTNSVMVVAMY